MARDPRKRLLVDPKVQGHLLLRIVVYWFLSMVVASLVMVWWGIADSANGTTFDLSRFAAHWRQYALMGIVASVLVLPVLLVDTVLSSNRFVGPALRIRRSMRELATGQPLTPLGIRNGDMWKGMADDFNAVVVYVDLLKKQAALAAKAAGQTYVSPIFNEAEAEALHQEAGV